jgi:prophage regulatory protein
MQNLLNLLRKNRVKERMGYGADSTLYDHAKKELITKPVKIGPRASAWPEYEIDAIVAARIAGKSDDEIREFVRELMRKREFILADVLAAA